MKLSIIIVTYNTADQIGRCLDSLAAAACCPQEIIVVDNASTDGGGDLIEAHHPSVRLIVNDRNRGFAAANNQALAVCRGEFVLFLNPDTEVGPGALGIMIDYMSNNPQVGLAGPKIVNPDGTLQESVSYRYPGQKQTAEELQGLKGTIACVLGAAMIARRELLNSRDGFDEDFFLYGEDQDLCLRIRRAGLEIGYIEAAPVMHLGGLSERATTSAELWRKKTRAEYLFYRKHYRPDTVARIATKERLKARYRIALLNITRHFPGRRQESAVKLARYRALIEETENRRGPGTPPGAREDGAPKYSKLIIYSLLTVLLIPALYEGLMALLISNPALLAWCPRTIQNSAGYLYSAGGRRVIQFTPACARYDSGLAYTLKPGSCTFGGVEFSNLYRINSLGVRDDDKSLDHPEIIVAGDSVAMGWGVNQEETFAQLLEKKIRRTVLNSAVSSYGTAREMLILRRIPTDRVQTLIIQYSGNDYEENREFYLHHNLLPTMSAADYRHYTAINMRPNNYYFGKNLRLKWEKILTERKNKKQAQPQKSKPLDKDEVDLFLNAVSQSGIDLGKVRIITFIVNGRDPADNREFNQALQKKIAAGSYPPALKSMIILDTATVLRKEHFYVLDDHPNRAGHEALATALMAAFKGQ